MTGFQLFGAITLFSTVGLVLVCFILYARTQRNTHFKCPYCGQRFKTSAGKSFFAARSGVDKRMICPNCGKLGYMEYMHDEDYIKEREEADQAEEKQPDQKGEE